MANGEGRTAAMVDGAERVREPQFRTVQQAPGRYVRTSVLDNLQPSGNGVSALDRQRLLLGVNKSAIGQSDDTFDKGLWLRNERPPSLYKTFG
jgi:hypothetical protein